MKQGLIGGEGRGPDPKIYHVKEPALNFLGSGELLTHFLVGKG